MQKSSQSYSSTRVRIYSFQRTTWDTRGTCPAIAGPTYFDGPTLLSPYGEFGDLTIANKWHDSTQKNSFGSGGTHRVSGGRSYQADVDKLILS